MTAAVHRQYHALLEVSNVLASLSEAVAYRTLSRREGIVVSAKSGSQGDSDA
jgi:hypothetical protein